MSFRLFRKDAVVGASDDEHNKEKKEEKNDNVNGKGSGETVFCLSLRLFKTTTKNR